MRVTARQIASGQSKTTGSEKKANAKDDITGELQQEGQLEEVFEEDYGRGAGVDH